MLGKSARLDGDYARAVSPAPTDHIPSATPPGPGGGRYRVRVSISAVGTGGKPLPMMCVCRDQYGREDTDVRTVRDVPAGPSPPSSRSEFDLASAQVIVFDGWSLPNLREFQQRGTRA